MKSDTHQKRAKTRDRTVQAQSNNGGFEDHQDIATRPIEGMDNEECNPNGSLVVGSRLREKMIEVCRRLHNEGVDIVCAPYEADAQLVLLQRYLGGLIGSQDSDLFAFGASYVS